MKVWGKWGWSTEKDAAEKTLQIGKRHDLALGKEILWWQWCSSLRQRHKRWQSFVHPSLMVAKAVLHLGFIKIKSNQIQTAQHRRRKTDRDLVSSMPHGSGRENHPQTCSPTHTMGRP